MTCSGLFRRIGLGGMSEMTNIMALIFNFYFDAIAEIIYTMDVVGQFGVFFIL